MVLYAGGSLVMSGTVSSGEFVAFGVYLAMLVWPMIALGWAVNLVQRGAASMGRINQLFREQPAITSPPSPPASSRPRAGRSRRVSGCLVPLPRRERAGLGAAGHLVPRRAPEQSLAIVGATGSGKSTLVDLLVRAYDPDRGAVLIDGVDIRQLSLLEDLRRAVGFRAPGDVSLRRDPAPEHPAGRARRWPAGAEWREVSQLTEALPALPDGYDTMLGERGINLSGGQKQRAAIARALAQDPPMFVLDDALSAVDAQTEARILAGLRSALSGRTSIIVSHRLAAVRDADWILVLDGGRIVEQGVHAELLAAAAVTGSCSGGSRWRRSWRKKWLEIRLFAEIPVSGPAATPPAE